MIDEQNPDEDRITHIDLLKRIQGMIGRIDKNKGEAIYEVHALRDNVESLLDAKIKENVVYMDKFEKSLDSKLNDFRKQIVDNNKKTLQEMTSKTEEAIAKVDKKMLDLQANVYIKIDDSIAAIGMDSKGNAVNTKKELEVVLNNAVSGMVAKLNEMRRYLDGRLMNLEEATLRTAQVEVNSKMAQVSTDAREAKEALETYRKEMNQAFTKYQAETMARTNELMNMFKSIKKQFGVIANALK